MGNDKPKEYRPDLNDPDMPARGLTDEDLVKRATVFKPDMLAGKTLLITGAGSGMGKAAAVLASRLGANVATCGRDAAKLEKTRDIIRDATGRELFQHVQYPRFRCGRNLHRLGP